MPIQLSSDSTDFDVFNFENDTLSKELLLTVHAISTDDSIESERNGLLKKKINYQFHPQSDGILRKISVQFKFYNNCKYVDVVITGKALETIHDIFFWDLEKVTEALRLEIDITADIGKPDVIPAATFRIENFKKKDEMYFEKMALVFPVEAFKSFQTAYGALLNQIKAAGLDTILLPQANPLSITVRVRTEGCIGLRSGNKFSRRQHTFMKTGRFSDIDIASTDGIPFPCYKLYLCAQSKVFNRMIQENSGQGWNNCITIEVETGVSLANESVEALVDYMVFKKRNFFKARTTLDLFLLAEKYEISMLFTETNEVLLEKLHPWYDIMTAMRMYRFSVESRTDYGLKLKQKAISILQMKEEEDVKECPLYQEIFMTATSRRMFASLVFKK